MYHHLLQAEIEELRGGGGGGDLENGDDLSHLCQGLVRKVTTSGKYSEAVRPYREISAKIKLNTEGNITKNCMYSITCSCGKEYRSEDSWSLKVSLEKHQKAIITIETMKSGMAGYVWREKVNPQPL